MKRTDAFGNDNNRFTNGNPATSTPATIVDDTWLNNVQEELCNFIESRGITLDGGDEFQLTQALGEYIGSLGDNFAQDFDTTTGLTFGYKAGKLRREQSIVSIVAGTIGLTASSTNQVYLDITDGAEVIATTTAAIPEPAVPLFEITTDGTGITLVTDLRTQIIDTRDSGLTTLRTLRNLVPWGSFDVWREAGATLGSVSSFYFAEYFLRAKNDPVGTVANVDITREEFGLGQTDVPGNPKNYMRMTLNDTGSGLNNAFSDTLTLSIEDFRTFSNEQCVVSFYAKSDIVGKEISVLAEQRAGSGGSPSSTQTHFVERKAITSSWARYQFTFTMPDISALTEGTDNNSSLIRFLIGIAYGSDVASQYGDGGGALDYGSTGDIDIAFVQIEKGDTATEFERLPMQQQIDLLSRHYQYFQWDGSYNIVYGHATSSTVVEGLFHFLETRIEPSVAFSAAADFNASTPPAGNSGGNSVNANSIGKWSFNFAVTRSGGMTAGDGGSISNDSTNSWIRIDARH